MNHSVPSSLQMIIRSVVEEDQRLDNGARVSSPAFRDLSPTALLGRASRNPRLTRAPLGSPRSVGPIK
jgi:hypothetical protein